MPENLADISTVNPSVLIHRSVITLGKFFLCWSLRMSNLKKSVIIAEACLEQKLFFLFNFLTKKLNIFPYLLPIFCCRFLMLSFVCIVLPLISLNVEYLDLNVCLPFPYQSKGHWSLLKKEPPKILWVKLKKIR
jgi:hypothetical protein